MSMQQYLRSRRNSKWLSSMKLQYQLLLNTIRIELLNLYCFCLV